MKLFENGVGRPSNEIKKKRRIFIASIVMTIVLLVTIGGILLFCNFNTNMLKGSAEEERAWGLISDYHNKVFTGNNSLVYDKYIVQNEDVVPGEIYRYPDNKLTFHAYVGLSVKRFDVYVYGDSSQKKQIDKTTIYTKKCNLVNNQKSVEIFIDKPGESVGYECDEQLGLYIGKWKELKNSVYVKIVAYNDTTKKDENVLSTSFYQLNKNSSDSIVFKLKEKKNEKYTSKVKLTSNLSIKCPDEVKEGFYFSCTYNVGTKKYSINNLYVGAVDKTVLKHIFVASGTTGTSAVFSFEKNSGDTGIIRLMKRGSKTVSRKIKIKKVHLSLECPTKLTAENLYEDKFYCTTNIMDADFEINGSDEYHKGYFRYDYIGPAFHDVVQGKYRNYKVEVDFSDMHAKDFIIVTASKKGYKTITKKLTIKQSKKANQTKRTLELKCPSSAMIGKKFKCTTNETGVKIMVGGAKSLASGVKSTFTTTASDKTKSIQYASRLFTDYKSQIKKDSNGEYINAKITATKTGYNSVTKYVKIYKTKTSGTTKKTTVKPATKTTTKKLTTVNNNDKKANFSVSAVWKGTGKDKKFNIIQGAFGSKVKYLAYVVCENKADCVRSDAWDYMNKKDSSAAVSSVKAKKGDSKVLTLKTSDSNVPANKKYYIRRSTYDANKKILYYSVYEIKTASSPRKNDKDVYNTTLTYITGKFY